VLAESDIELPDVLTDLQDRTRLTRRSIQRILAGSDRLDDFLKNPQEFIELAADAIYRCKRMALVDGIKYQRLGDEHYFAQELFENEELTGYLRNMIEAKKSVHEQVVYDLGGERAFAEGLEKNTAIKIYAKLSDKWFKIPTPLGSYTPDWAVLVQHDDSERLYFVVETKPSALLVDDARRGTENAKIACGRCHFEAVGPEPSSGGFVVAGSVDDFLAATMQ
jgi:type III restriction enzyme